MDRCYVFDPFCQPRNQDNTADMKYEAIIYPGLGVLVAVCIIAGFFLFRYKNKPIRGKKRNGESHEINGKSHNKFSVVNIVKFHDVPSKFIAITQLALMIVS